MNRAGPHSENLVISRTYFILNTYLHLLLAIFLFGGIELFLFKSGLATPIAEAALSVNWLVPLGAFILVGCLAAHTAQNTAGLAAQYFALFIYVVAEALIFVPLLYLAERYAPGVIDSAVIVTGLGVIALTLIVLLTAKDFSFLKAFLLWTGLAALLLIIASCISGLHLGIWFSLGMTVYAGLCILYDTSNVLHHYREDQYVAASLELFSSVALMFWYVIRLFVQFDIDFIDIGIDF